MLQKIYDLIDIHADELLLYSLIVGGIVVYFWRPDIKDIILTPAMGAFIMALRNKSKNGNGAPKP